MADFKFIQDPISDKWIISAPKRASRPDQAEGVEPPCPFEPFDSAQGKPGYEESIFSINQARVVANKFPFAPIHEIIIHSDDHHKNFDEMALSQSEDVFQVFKNRFQEHKDKGQVYIFHNQGKRAGESLPHPHTQLTVIPNQVELEISRLHINHEEKKDLTQLYIFCPGVSQWPDEVWLAPHRKDKFFGESDEREIKELAFAVSRLLQILSLRHGHDFPFNFYIYPGINWYLRFIPRLKTLGGFEVGTGVFVNTQVPDETFQFIKEHFDNPDFEKIKSIHLADYGNAV